MKCPMLTAAYITHGQTESGGEGKYSPRILIDCLKTECAWWDETWRSCVLHHMASKS